MRAVLFDLFETLVSYFDPDWRPPPRTTAERLGIDARFWSEHWPGFDRRWQAGALETYDSALRAVCAAAGVAPDPAVLAELVREYTDYAARTAFLRADPEVLAMLRGLRSAGAKVAVVTNATDLDMAPWPAHELAREVDVLVASCDVRLLKPDPRIYALACERLGVAPADAIFIGDGGSNELQGAREAGLAPYWCTWFLDRWPEGIRPNGFGADGWRQHPSRHPSPWPRLHRPADVLEALVSRPADRS